MTFTAPVPVKDMSALEKWILKKTTAEKNSILEVQSLKESRQTAKILKLQKEADSVVTAQATLDPVDESVKTSTNIETSSPSIQTPLSDPQPEHNIVKQKNLPTVPKYDFDDLIKTRNIDAEAIKWLFDIRKPKRQQRLKTIDVELFETLQMQFLSISGDTKVTISHSSDEYVVEDYLSLDSMVEPVANLQINTYKYDDYSAIEDHLGFDLISAPLADTKNGVTSNDDHNIEDSLDFDSPKPPMTDTTNHIAVVRKSGGLPKYDLYELSEKDDLNFDELRYIFASTTRKEKIRSLVPPSIFDALQSKFHQIKHSTKDRIHYPIVPPKYDVNELVKKDDLSLQEVRWIFKKKPRLISLNKIDPELFFMLKKSQTFLPLTENTPPKYDISELAENETLDIEALRWIFRKGTRRQSFGQLIGTARYESFKQQLHDANKHDL